MRKLNVVAASTKQQGEAYRIDATRFDLLRPWRLVTVSPTVRAACGPIRPSYLIAVKIGKISN